MCWERGGGGYLAAKLSNLILAFIFPLHDILVLQHTHRTAGKDESTDGVVVVSLDDSLLVARRSTGLGSADEASAHPNGLC